jgi:hypothetical protein
MAASPVCTGGFYLGPHLLLGQGRRRQCRETVGRVEQSLSAPATNLFAQQAFQSLGR